ncbi:MAG TPA: ABC transporter substrate-binding protein [Burkholderiaceae bacterium]|nr:ABC transporter substrate-binding protein [Burkholderiaceae bacterium]
MTEHGMNDRPPGAASRRGALKKLAGLTAGGAGALQAPWVHAAETFKIGYVSPQTGPLAVFAEPDGFVLGELRKHFAGGIKAGGKIYPLEIVVKDSQSSSSRAAEVTSDLILKDKVDIVVGSATPETTNPVADTCELNGMPCVTNDTPWQPHFFGRGGDPKKGFEWTYHFFWGLEDVVAVYTGIWEKLSTNGVVGALWPNDPDGNAWGDARLGFPAAAAAKRLKFVDKGRFQSPADDFSAQIIDFKKNGVEIVSGVLPPPDFANFWAQAGQQGFRPKIVTVGKATEFPAAIQAFGPRANGLSVEVWWSPFHPFRSSLTGQSSKEIAAAYTKATNRQWSMPLGFKHSLFEVAIAAFQKAGGKGAKPLRDAIRATDLTTIVGPVNFTKGPVPNVSKTPLVGGQWKKQGAGFELVIVENGQATMVPLGGKLDPIA